MTSDPLFTLADLEAARAEHARWEQAWDNYSGNNSDKYAGPRKQASAKVAQIEAYLKDTGVLPRSEQELLERELDRAFPQARHRDIVEWQGARYERLVTPGEFTRSRKVKSWSKSWRHVADTGDPAP